jgi:hypothetical protein
MYLEDFVKAKKPLSYWRELLQEWTFMVHRVYRISGGKSSVYSEKERANTGLLAAAAVRNGWVALEECRTQKVDRHSSDQVYDGRCDLVLWRDKRHHEIEAKFTRISLHARTNNRIEKAYSKAMADSSRSTEHGYRSEKKLAITYVVPVVEPSRLEITSEAEIGVQLRDMIDEIKHSYEPLLFAYAFSGPAKLVGSDKIGLGVILIGDIT